MPTLVYNLSLESMTKYFYVSSLRLSILTDLKSAVDRMTSILPLVSNSSRLFPSLSEPFQGHQLQLNHPSLHGTQFIWLSSNIQVLVHLLADFIFTFVCENSKIHKMTIYFFFLIITMYDLPSGFGDQFLSMLIINAWYDLLSRLGDPFLINAVI